MTDYATPEDVGELTQTMSREHMQCRDDGHPWRPSVDKEVTLEDGRLAYERVRRCPRCKSKRVQLVSAAGAILKGDYDYAKGYPLHGYGRIIGEARNALRLASIRRNIEQQTKGSTNGTKGRRS